MNDKTRSYVNEWLRYANNDILNADTLFENKRINGAIPFLCQQAVEKCLKAFLAAHAIPIKKIHDLNELYADVSTIKPFGFDEDLLSKLTKDYIADRYPHGYGVLSEEDLTEEEAQQYLTFAKEVQEKIKTAIAEQQTE